MVGVFFRRSKNSMTFSFPARSLAFRQASGLSGVPFGCLVFFVSMPEVGMEGRTVLGRGTGFLDSKKTHIQRSIAFGFSWI